MIDPQPGDRVRMTLIGTFGYDRHNRSSILTVRNQATGAIYEVPVHVEAAFTPAEASAAALAEAIRDANIGWDEMQNSATAETWPGTWDEWVADALIEAGYIATPPAASTPDTELRELYARALEKYDDDHSSAPHEGYHAGMADAVMAVRDEERETDQLVLREQVRKQGEKIAVMSTLLRGLARRVGGFRRVYVELARIAGDTAAERDLAIAHDRQPYPTAWAYEQACAALHRTQAELAALRAQQQDMVRLPADARGEIERLLTANVGKPAGGVAHKLMLLLTDDWRASPTSTEDPADTCDCAGEQCAGPREICAAFPTEPESLKAQYSVRSLDYIRELYRVPAEVNGRVIFDGDPGKITGALGPYLLVLLDGDVEPVPVHPTWHMSYAATEDEGGEH